MKMLENEKEVKYEILNYLFQKPYSTFIQELQKIKAMPKH